MTSSGILPWLCSYRHFIQDPVQIVCLLGAMGKENEKAGEHLFHSFWGAEWGKLEPAAALSPSSCRLFLMEAGRKRVLWHWGWSSSEVRHAPEANMTLLPLACGEECPSARRNWSLLSGASLLERMKYGVQIPPNKCTTPDGSSHSLGPSLDQRLSVFVFDYQLL